MTADADVLTVTLSLPIEGERPCPRWRELEGVAPLGTQDGALRAIIANGHGYLHPFLHDREG